MNAPAKQRSLPVASGIASAAVRWIGILAALLVGFGSAARAQQPRDKSLGSPAVPTLQMIDAADRNQDRTMVQRRLFRTDGGTVVTVREQLTVDANGSAQPAFGVSFLAVEGELPGSPVSMKWQQNYQRSGALLFRQSTFRVRDLGKALANYTVHDFGPVIRAGRAARRLVVFPAAIDKSIWLLDVDVNSNLVLYAIEFDSLLRVLSEVEAVTVALTASPAGLTTIGPSATFAGAVAQLTNQAGVIDPVLSSASEYARDRIEVRVDPWNGRQKLVMSYTDGIDQFWISQAPNSPDPFAGLPGSNGGNTIARYRDPVMSILTFWDANVSFEVAGSGALQRLDQVAKGVYVQALTN